MQPYPAVSKLLNDFGKGHQLAHAFECGKDKTFEESL